MKIYLVRHGQTELNAKGCYYGSLDPDLNREGVSQAELLKTFFDEVSISKAYVSPLTRARRTATIILEGSHQGVPIISDERLMEQHFGVLEGMTYQEIMDQKPEIMNAWNQDYDGYRIPEGESFAMVRQRIDDFVHDVLSKENKETGTMLIAAHKGTLGHLLASLLHMPLNGYWNFVFDQGCYNEIDLEDGYAIIRRLNVPVKKN